MGKQDSLEKTTLLGRHRRQQKRKTIHKWVDSIKEGIDVTVQELSRAVEVRTPETLYLLNNNSLHPLPPVPENLLSISMNLTVLSPLSSPFL